MPVRYSAICLSISIHVNATFFSNKLVHCKYHCFFTAGDFLSSMAISWDQGRSSHSSQLPCQVCIPLSRVFRYTFSWILGGEEWQMFNFQCTPLSTIWCSNTRYGRVYGKWQSFRDDKHRVLIISGGISVCHCHLLVFTLKPKGSISSFFQCQPIPPISSCPPRTPSSPRTGPQRAPNHRSGQHLLMCQRQILPLVPASPVTILGFSKVHSSVSYWINYCSFFYYSRIASSMCDTGLLLIKQQHSGISSPAMWYLRI